MKRYIFAVFSLVCVGLLISSLYLGFLSLNPAGRVTCWKRKFWNRINGK